MAIDNLMNITRLEDLTDLARTAERLEDAASILRRAQQLSQGADATLSAGNVLELARSMEHVQGMRRVDNVFDLVRLLDELPQAARVADTVAQASRFNPVRMVSNYLNSAPTRAQQLVFGTMLVGGVYAYGLIERQTGGEITYNMMNGAADTITASYHALEEQFENREEFVNWLALQYDRFDFLIPANVLDTLAQNGLVMAAYQSSDDPAERIQAAEHAALAFQLRNPILLTAKNAIRSNVINEVYGDLPREERDLMMAQGFVQDLIHGADCAALRDIDGAEVTEEDIGQLLTENVTLAALIPENLRNGLTQIYPELETAFEEAGPGPEAPDTEEVEAFLSENAPEVSSEDNSENNLYDNLAVIANADVDSLSTPDLRQAFTAAGRVRSHLGRNSDQIFGINPDTWQIDLMFKAAGALQVLDGILGFFGLNLNLGGSMQRMAISAVQEQVEVQFGSEPGFQQALARMQGNGPRAVHTAGGPAPDQAAERTPTVPAT